MNQMKKEELEITISDSDRIECAIRHIKTAVDVDPWAVEIAVEAMEKEISALQAQDSPKPKAESVQNVQNEDLISRKAAIDAECEVCQIAPKKERGHNCTYYVHGCKEIECLRALPSAQPEPCEDAVSRQAAIDAALSAFSRGLLASPDIRKLPSVKPEPHWIPVSERLPDMWDERYLVSLAWGGIGVMEYKSTGFHNYGSFAPVPIESITAWMPLPEPYREERRTDE